MEIVVRLPGSSIVNITKKYVRALNDLSLQEKYAGGMRKFLSCDGKGEQNLTVYYMH
jgi:hypothetical protein